MSIHKVYDELRDDEKYVVDEAFSAVARVFKDNHRGTAYDDRAERLVEAIAVYLAESEQ